MGGVRCILAGFAAGIMLGMGGYVAVSGSAASDPRVPMESALAPHWPAPLTIRNEHGGGIVHHVLRLTHWRETETPLRFVGRCASACTLYLALPYEQTCIAEGVSFRFHAPSAETLHARRIAEDYMLRIYPEWVRSWIEERGGLSKDFITMEFDYARRHMRICEPERTPERTTQGLPGSPEIGL